MLDTAGASAPQAVKEDLRGAADVSAARPSGAREHGPSLSTWVPTLEVAVAAASEEAAGCLQVKATSAPGRPLRQSQGTTTNVASSATAKLGHHPERFPHSGQAKPRRRPLTTIGGGLASIEMTLTQRRQLATSSSAPQLPTATEMPAAVLGKATTTVLRTSPQGLVPRWGSWGSVNRAAQVGGQFSPTGWILQADRKNQTSWVQQTQSLSLIQLRNPSVARDRSIHERLQLLEVLENENIAPGSDALRTALMFRCGSIEEAYAQLDVRSRGEHRGVTLLEFAGGIALLGLDAPALCGFNERDAFLKLDSDGDGRVGVEDLRPGKEREIVVTSEVQLDRWVLIAKFVALVAWFGTPSHLRRRPRQSDIESEDSEEDQGIDNETAVARAAEAAEAAASRAEISLRNATHAAEEVASVLEHRRNKGQLEVTEELAHGGAEKPSRVSSNTRPSQSGKPHVSGTAAVSARAAALGGGTRTARPNARHLALDSLRRCWAPSYLDFEAIQQAMELEFAKFATAERNGTQLLCRADFCHFFGDLPPMGVKSNAVIDLGASRFTSPAAVRIYDQALEVQIAMSTLNGRPCHKGLTFQSFRTALLQVALQVGLHFRHLVDDAVDAFHMAVQDALVQKRGPPMATSRLLGAC